MAITINLPPREGESITDIDAAEAAAIAAIEAQEATSIAAVAASVDVAVAAEVAESAAGPSGELYVATQAAIATAEAAVEAEGDAQIAVLQAAAGGFGQIRPETYGAVGDGVAEDGAAWRLAIAAAVSQGVNRVLGTAGKTYLCEKAAAGKDIIFGGAPASTAWTIEIPSGVIIDLQGATLKVADEDSTFISNKNSAATTDANLGIINGVIDGAGFNMTAGGGAYFYGVDGLVVDNVTFINGSRYALLAERCVVDIGSVTFKDWDGNGLGTGIYSGVCSGSIGSVIAIDLTAKADESVTMPGNPGVIGGSGLNISRLYASGCAGGWKLTKLRDTRVGGVVTLGGTSINAGLKVQGNSQTDLCERVVIGEVLSEENDGAGLFAIFCDDVQIGSFMGINNCQAGASSNQDITLAGNISIGRAKSVGAGIGPLRVVGGASFYSDYFEVTIGEMEIQNPFTVVQGSTDTAVSLAGGYLEINSLRIIDDRSTPYVDRLIDTTRDRGSKIVVNNLYARGYSSSTPFWHIGGTDSWIGNVDAGKFTFPAAGITLSALSGSVTVTADASVFAATDVGVLIFTNDGALLEITAYTSATVVTASVRASFVPSSLTYAANAWRTIRAGKSGVFTLTAAATTTDVLNQSFSANGTQYGVPIIDIIPLNSAARTLGIPNYSAAAGKFVASHGAAAGGEAYAYSLRGYMASSTAIS